MVAQLEWCVGPDGGYVRAESFTGVDPRKRPRVRCPACEEVVTIRAGKRGVVTPHVAHRARAMCQATTSETAAHMNAKFRLAELLGARSALCILSRCPAWHEVEVAWIAPRWIRAVPEFRVGTRRPDVALLGEGNVVVAAVEVLHTHRVDIAKAEDLARQDLPWIEVSTESALAWNGRQSLRIEAADDETLHALTTSCGGCWEDFEEERVWRAEVAAEDAAEAARQAATAEAAQRAKAAERALRDATWRWERRLADFMAGLDDEIRRRPRLDVVIGYATRSMRVVVGAVVAREGARSNVKVLPSQWLRAAEWEALRHALQLVETHAAGAASIWTTEAVLCEANCGHHPSVLGDVASEPRAQAVDAVARTRSVVLPLDDRAPDVVRLRSWQTTVKAACEAELERVAQRARGTSGGWRPNRR